MRLWHQKLLPHLDRQRLLGQHRECCALRGKGWGKKHATVDYVFTHGPEWLVSYHLQVMDEMRRRGYNPDPVWGNPLWRGSALGEDYWVDWKTIKMLNHSVVLQDMMIYPEHNDEYLRECIALLKEKQAPIDWEKVVEDGLEQVQPSTP